MRIHRGVVVLVTLSMVGALAGAGSAGATVADKKKPLTKKAFIKEADKICLQAATLQNEIAQDYFADLPPGENPDLETLSAFWEEDAPIVQQMIDSIRALNEPKADKKKVKKILDAVQRGLDEIEEDPAVLLTEAPFAEADELAKSYGFKVCGADNAE